MAQYFEVSVRYDKITENGSVKRVTEKFLADALTPVEAIETATRELQPYISGDFFLPVIKETRISELMGSPDASRFWLAKLAFITYDEKSGKERKSTVPLIIGAEDFDEALATLRQGMKDTLADWQTESLSETPIRQIFRHT